MNEKWLLRMPFILISSGEFLYTMHYFMSDDKHGWNAMLGIATVVYLFIPTIAANLIIFALAVLKLRVRAITQILVSVAIFIFYCCSIGLH